MTPVVRVPWLVLTLVVVGLGIVGAALAGPVASLSGLAAGAGVGGLLHHRVPPRAVARLLFGPLGRPGGSRRGWAHRPLSCAPACAGGGLVLVGLFSLLGSDALGFTAAWTAGAWALRGEGGAPPPHPARPVSTPHDGDGRSSRDDVARQRQECAAAAAAPVPACSGWSTERVCRAWQTSFVRLLSARSTGDTAAVARLAWERQAYLDELDRRDRPGLTAWLASGARAAGDPSRHLEVADGTPGPTAVPLRPDRPDTTAA